MEEFQSRKPRAASISQKSTLYPHYTVPFRFAGGACRRIRRISAAERSLWFPPVGIDLPVSDLRNSAACKLLLGRLFEKFTGSTEDLPHPEFFKMYFGWLGNAEVNFGKNRAEFSIALHALFATIETLGSDPAHLAIACEEAYCDLNTIAMIRCLHCS